MGSVFCRRQRQKKKKGAAKPGKKLRKKARESAPIHEVERGRKTWGKWRKLRVRQREGCCKKIVQRGGKAPERKTP